MSTFQNFQTFDAKKYMGDEDVKALVNLIGKYIIDKAAAENHALTYDEIVKILNVFWWRRDVRDNIIQVIWKACHPDN
jgi:hypothetical protein